ncbi:uncharacterized protein ColSpa_02313 [Colletotrichum spaethianum]|uniref:Uncharacterized protein n=1 Tax=Colletotrichum spaethianum TaxID=700344 RepID=A0AA37LDA3_9PEZI|nr:uncharacterized protein ColSpa_02313 [Colletotrichum spaethianum]GKT42132.1 hypothetical protein ColSpa_02313 [Colletotrichum spaethianum]
MTIVGGRESKAFLRKPITKVEGPRPQATRTINGARPSSSQIKQINQPTGASTATIEPRTKHMTPAI